ncbi:MAG: D-2-hydroxyacid dehydrogenase [Proteobacteria bacterium]|nr:D-2-hydroxyacid dehydrogenase [Pseudomonadota bacterium]
MTDTSAIQAWRRGIRVVGPLCAWMTWAGSGHAVAASLPEPRPEAVALIAELGLPESPTPSRELPGWRPPTKIAVAFADEEQLARLRAAVPGVELVAIGRESPLAQQVKDVQAVVGVCSAEVLEAAPGLHWIQILSVGAERCVAVPGLAGRDIVLTNLQRTSAVPIAEHAIAMMMSLARGLPYYGRAQQAGLWQRDAADRPGVREIGGRTLLVVGLGGIGTEVARRAQALGMQVIAIRNSRREGPGFVAEVGLPADLHAFARRADVVVSALPLTPETTGLFDEAFFRAMKPGGWFINVGRGRSVVTDALLAALDDGRLAGAGLDVTDPEPLPKGHRLWSQPNVIITPHIAASSDTQGERYWILVAENLRRYAAGEPLLNVVDIARGY